MMNSISGYDKWLTTPPDDDPICEGEHGCGDYLERDPLTGEWLCVNEFCPTKFDGVAQRMAEALVEYMEESHTLKAQLARSRREVARLVEMYSNSGLE